MTIEEIARVLDPKNPPSRRQVHRYLNRFGIAPLGLRRRPQRYPDNAAKLILAGFGAPLTALPTERLAVRNVRAGAGGRNGVVSIKALRAERQKARGK